MASLARFVRLALGACTLFLLVATSAPSQAQQVNPTASSVKEQQLLQELNRVQGRVSIPDQRSGVLEQPAGRDWREFRNVTLRWIGGIAILGTIVALVIFYLIRGMVRIESGRSGRTIVGFDLTEVAPDPDGDQWDGNVGARLLYKMIGWMLKSQRA